MHSYYQKTPNAIDSAVDLYMISFIISTNVVKEPLVYTVTYLLHTLVLSHTWRPSWGRVNWARKKDNQWTHLPVSNMYSAVIA